jgi:alkanesulfonate monooxygenase SsuD/methylene tetrahydromethanopterin reductase-like flavin-dependent oxidoreductase (luciferase family)
MDDAFVNDVVASVTREHVTNGFPVGTAAEVAAQVELFLELGIDHVCAFDYLPIVADPANPPAGLGRAIELCARIKKN